MLLERFEKKFPKVQKQIHSVTRGMTHKQSLGEMWMNGPTGPQGCAGNPGITGSTGQIGPQGVVGPQGAVGAYYCSNSVTTMSLNAGMAARPELYSPQFSVDSMKFADCSDGEAQIGAQLDMGLAAGGRMRQQIFKDPHGIEVWDTKHKQISHGKRVLNRKRLNDRLVPVLSNPEHDQYGHRAPVQTEPCRLSVRTTTKEVRLPLLYGRGNNTTPQASPDTIWRMRRRFPH